MGGDHCGIITAIKRLQKKLHTSDQSGVQFFLTSLCPNVIILDSSQVNQTTETTEMYKEYEVLTLGAELKKLLEKKSEPLMQKYGLRKIELDILAYLASGHYGDTAKDIMGQKHISKAHVSKSIDNLKALGFIRLHEDREDHRFNHIFLMEKSDAVIKDFLKVHEECWHVLLHGISEEERIFLDQICGRMQQNITEELRKL